MSLLRPFLTMLCALSLSTALQAAPVPYDEAADANAQVAAAQKQSAQSKKPLLLLFGANWCGDCVALDASLKSERNAALVSQSFVVVKVDVGNFNRNLELAQRYGNPIKKGIPAAVVLSPQGELLYATKAGELSNARKMSETGVYDFFKDVLAQTQR